MIEESYLEHYGMPRRSGRYPWGSGKNPMQRNRDFYETVSKLRKQGMSNKDIAAKYGITTAELRKVYSIAKDEKKLEDISTANKYKAQGLSNVAIGKKMGINDTTVRNLLNPALKERAKETQELADVLKKSVAKKGYIDYGKGTEKHLQCSKDKLDTAVKKLEMEGYTTHKVYVEQLGVGGGKKTAIKVLAPPGTDYATVMKNKDKIDIVTDYYTDDGGRTYNPASNPKSISSKRVKVRTLEDGGDDLDGVIELRRDVKDLSLGSAKYAQVRIAVDGTHYMKGMAIYSDNIPKGYDVVYNTHKAKGKNKLAYMKEMDNDSDNPFGATIKGDKDLNLVQRYYKDKNGKKQKSAINVVSEEGYWDGWSKQLSSQFLSKQPVSLAKKQLDLKKAYIKADYDDIMKVTNPTLKKHLLNEFANKCDAEAVHLKAAAMPRQGNYVILPSTKIKPNEIYATKYKNGERVVLVRYPHAGRFELPELTVNNKNPKLKKAWGNLGDAVVIHPKAAKQLSGADFDGDTVTIIPNKKGMIKVSKAIKGLADFDTISAYPAVPGMKRMTKPQKQLEMGKVSNLITDMQIKGAKTNDVVKAVRHSMVVIDAEKHNLNWKQSYKDNGIAEINKKYRGSARKGASTLISKAKSEVWVAPRKERQPDKLTGKRVYVPNNSKNARKIKSSKMFETDNAHTLSSGTLIETVYGNFANSMKSMANKARKQSLSIKGTTYSKSANKVYSKEVKSLLKKLDAAYYRKPFERRAHTIANKAIEKRIAGKEIDPDKKKKIRNEEPAIARAKVGKPKEKFNITNKEWEAIQSGALHNSKVKEILLNADSDQVKKLATPKTKKGLSSGDIARAKAMINAGATQAEVADALGISTSTLSRAL